jgi:hypothetical protein
LGDVNRLAHPLYKAPEVNSTQPTIVKTSKRIILLSGIAGVALLANAANAATTYFDATDTASGNTSIAPSAGGGVFTGLAAQGPANDGAWDKRAFGNGASIYQNASTTAAVDVNAVRLETSVSGLPMNTYDVYVYFWSDNSPTWRIGASLSDTPGQLSLYQPGGANVTQFYTGSDGTVLSTALAQNPFDSAVMVAEGNRRLYQAWIGTTTGTGFDVFIEGDRSMTGFNQRTWYDGVGYSVVVPEPSSFAFVGCGLVALIATRRLKR